MMKLHLIIKYKFLVVIYIYIYIYIYVYVSTTGNPIITVYLYYLFNVIDFYVTYLSLFAFS